MMIHTEKGFSFVEVLVSVGILGLIVTALIGFFPHTMELNDVSQDTTIAVSHVQYILEDIRASSGVIKTQIDANVWDLNTDAHFTSKDLTRLNNETIDTSYDPVKTPAEVTVVVSWDMRNGRHETFTFTTIDSGV